MRAPRRTATLRHIPNLIRQPQRRQQLLQQVLLLPRLTQRARHHQQQRVTVITRKLHARHVSTSPESSSSSFSRRSAQRHASSRISTSAGLPRMSTPPVTATHSAAPRRPRRAGTSIRKPAGASVITTPSAASRHERDPTGIAPTRQTVEQETFQVLWTASYLADGAPRGGGSGDIPLGSSGAGLRWRPGSAGSVRRPRSLSVMRRSIRRVVRARCGMSGMGGRAAVRVAGRRG